MGTPHPLIPVIHEDDTAQATLRILLEAPAGAYNLNAPNPPVPLQEITQRTNARVLTLPPGA
jgi:hypothetical protein